MPETLVSAEELADNIDAWRVVDCRASLGDREWGRQAYAAGHIAAAVFADLGEDLAARPGSLGRHPLPDRDRLTERFRDFGVNASQQMVFYDDAGGAFAARAWWLARWLGHAPAAVLDGGLAAWKQDLAAGQETVERGDFAACAPLTEVIEVDELAAKLDRFCLIDARTEARFAGLEEPIDPIAGHIPGASCRPFQGNLNDDGEFLSAETLRGRFEDLVASKKPVVCYCGSGVTAAHNILALRVAGFGEAKLYPGSWSGWITDPRRPREPDERH